MGERQTREFLDTTQVNVGPCVACGKRVWHNPGDKVLPYLIEKYGGAIHKRPCAGLSLDELHALERELKKEAGPGAL